MSQHRQLIPVQDAIDCPEDDYSDYIVQTTQDRLKRKRQKRFKILLICGFVCLLIIIIVAAAAVPGALLGGAKKTDHDGNNMAGTIYDTSLLHSSTIGISTGYIASTDHTDIHTRPTGTSSSSQSHHVATSSHSIIASTTSPVTATSVLTRAHIRLTSSRIIISAHTLATSSRITSSTHTFTSLMTPTPTTSPTPPPGDMENSKVLNYINTHYEPCEDFYKYSCGNWWNNHPRAAEWGTSEDLALDNYNKIAGYLSRYVSAHDPDAIKKAKYIYSACTDTDYIEDNYLDKAENFMIKEGAGWEHGGLTPSYSWSIDSNLYEDHYLGSSAFFSFGIVPDDLNSSKPVITVSQDGLTYSPEKYFDYDYDLGSVIENILDAFDPYGHHYTTAQDIADFEHSLASHWVSKTELDNATATYNPMTLDELAEIFSMDWINYFNNYFEKAGYSGNLDGSTVVIVKTPSYFRAINSYLTRSTVKDYAKWQLLLHALSLYIAPLPQDNWKIFRDTKFPKTTKLSDDTKLSCIELIETVMPLAVARPFVEEFTTGSMKVKVGEIAEQLKIAFKQRILEKDWLDETTKNRTIEKVNAITEQVAYPDFIKTDRELNLVYDELDISRGINYFSAVTAMYKFVHNKMISRYFHPIDKTEWLDSPTEVNAYYSAQFNQFVILAGILRPPFYAVNWYPFLVYGALGAVIGHELTHGFDDEGQQYNKDGNRVKWWTDHSIQNFRERTQCFVDQYNQYSLQGYSIDGQFTLGENIADNGGIHAAFRAYKNVMNGTSENVRGHSGDQLFFVAFAQLWCSSFTDDALESDIKTDPHSPGPIRVLGSLVNSEEFTNAFQCSRGSRMYPNDDRCELW